MRQKKSMVIGCIISEWFEMNFLQSMSNIATFWICMDATFYGHGMSRF